MFAAIKQQWQQLRKAPPGERFQKRYRRSHARVGKPLWRITQIVIGVILVIGGIIFCFIPGPGLPLIFIGAGLLANHSLAIARAMDWLELRIRKILRWARGWWQHASIFARYAVVIVGALLAGGSGYGAYKVMFD